MAATTTWTSSSIQSIPAVSVAMPSARAMHGTEQRGADTDQHVQPDRHVLAARDDQAAQSADDETNNERGDDAPHGELHGRPPSQEVVHTVCVVPVVTAKCPTGRKSKPTQPPKVAERRCPHRASIRASGGQSRRWERAPAGPAAATGREKSSTVRPGTADAPRARTRVAGRSGGAPGRGDGYFLPAALPSPESEESAAMKASCGHLHPADHLHPLLAFLLLLQQLALPGDVTAVALGEHVLADRPDGLPGDHPAADGGLDRHLELLARDQLAQLRRDA